MNVVLDTSEFKEYESQLRAMSRSAFPLAVRGTLNDAAKNMKIGGAIQEEFDENFTVRRRTFIKAFTGYSNCSNTFDINQMKSEAGVYKGKKDQKVGEDLQLQEFGGRLNDRAVPTAKTRLGESMLKIQKGSLFYRRFKNAKRTGAVIMGTDELGVIMKTKDGRIVRKTKDGEVDKWETLYVAKGNYKINKEPFIYPAALSTQRLMPSMFIKNADKRLKKIKK